MKQKIKYSIKIIIVGIILLLAISLLPKEIGDFIAWCSLGWTVGGVAETLIGRVEKNET